MSGPWQGRGFVGCAALAGLLGACALTGKGDALYPRFYSPETETSAVVPAPPAAPALALRLGQVDAASHVEERFAYRVEPSELSYYEDRRWTEPPERYLRRALERELFQRRGIRRVVSGPGATLDPALPTELRLPAIGEIYVENALAALGAALAAAVPAEQAVARLAELPAPPGRFQVVRTRPYVVVDYAHSPDALARTLATARALCRGELSVVFGAGGDRDRAKRPLLGAAARSADHIVLTSDNPRREDPLAIMAAVEAGISPHANLVKEPDRASAIRLAIGRAAPEDVVLIAGKGHELEQVTAGARLPFSDVAIALESGIHAPNGILN